MTGPNTPMTASTTPRARRRAGLPKRLVWQLASTILHNAYIPAYFSTSFLYQGILKNCSTSTLNCYACPSALVSCPIGSLQNFAMRRQFPFFLVGFFVAIGMAVGRMTCGWLCPFGLLQDAMKRISRRVVRLPVWMGYLKYVSLVVLAIVLPLAVTESWFSKLCPQGAIEGAIPWALAAASGSDAVAGMDVASVMGTMFWTKIAILAGFLTLMVFIKRPFCRMACPMGAILSVFNRVSYVRLTVNEHACNKCNFCRDVCPVDLEAYRQVDSPECIKCLECTKCPRGAIKMTVGFGPRQAPRPVAQGAPGPSVPR
ncbi:MAG: 4Fe-4S binding protein [bacterium]